MPNHDTDTGKKKLLINKAGYCRYDKPEAVENLIRYISRENGKDKQDLICCGAFGASEYTDITTTIRQFECVQQLHRRNGNFGRYIDHEIYSFSSEEEKAIIANPASLKLLARKMAANFYEDNFQVYYGVHKPDDVEHHLHIHFAVNTVNFRTGKKRHENKKETKNHQEKLHCIVEETLSNL